jgi:dihydropyrimidinase
MFDLVIRNGQVVTASEVAVMDVGITGEKNVVLGHALGSGQREIDARGLIVLPGGIDSHVHISQPSGEGIVMADDFASGTLSALMGGTTTVMPFCLQQKGESLRAALNAYHALAEGNCHTDVSFHHIVSGPSRPDGCQRT